MRRYVRSLVKREDARRGDIPSPRELKLEQSLADRREGLDIESRTILRDNTIEKARERFRREAGSAMESKGFIRTEEAFFFYGLLERYLRPLYSPRNEHKVLIVGLLVREEDYAVRQFLNDFYDADVFGEKKARVELTAVNLYPPPRGSMAVTQVIADASTPSGWERIKELRRYDKFDLIIVRGLDPTSEPIGEIIKEALKHRTPDGRIVATAKDREDIMPFKGIAGSMPQKPLVLTEDKHGIELNLDTDPAIAIW